jgi:ABC-type transport system involved in cytochrome bd biosynthesis fused ATPase/permease subunit
MVIWRGWGVLAFIYAAVAMILFAGAASSLVPDTALPLTVAIGMIIAAVATWFTGNTMNRVAPQRKIDAWARQRRAQLDELVATGRFSLGPGQPQPQSLAEAQQMSDALFAQELQQTKRALNVHTLFWIPMQYFAFVWAAIALIALVSGVVGMLR